jgi:hypothetical protein
MDPKLSDQLWSIISIRDPRSRSIRGYETPQVFMVLGPIREPATAKSEYPPASFSDRFCVERFPDAGEAVE